jgi:Trp operon repressor
MFIRLEILPSAGLTENRRRRMHWAVYAKLVQAEKEKFYQLLLAAWDNSESFSGRVNLRYRFFFKTATRRDRDGLGQRLKVVQDLLGKPVGKDIAYKLGIIVDDSDLYVSEWTILQTVYRASSDALEIEIQKAEE